MYLPYELKGGRFSALAKEENISGVHTIANLAKKRLPLMVRLAHGSAPLANGSPGGKAAQQLFVPEMRLLARSDEAGGWRMRRGCVRICNKRIFIPYFY